jgi:hypothetical protein
VATFSLQQRQALLRSAIDVVEVVREKEFGADGRKKKWTSNPLTLTMHTRLYPSNIDAFYV